MKENPFPAQGDRWSIWNMLVARDIKAFVNADWNMVADDFIKEGFMGINAAHLGNPDAWRLSYPTLKAYKEEWLRQARLFKAMVWSEDLEAALFRVTILRDIEVHGDAALVHKKFFGELTKAGGEQVPTNWQTLYRCRKIGDTWKIAGFTGYMPHFLGNVPNPSRFLKKAPAQAAQHKTAGPYSPVLEITPGKLVVISGQAAIDMDGQVIGDTIEEQATLTLENCKKQLAQAGCVLDDVFKVNVYLKDLGHWPRFNQVYETYFTEPLPVRTTVAAGLLLTLQVEIEMWAVKS